jgi:hypothetical protein
MRNINKIKLSLLITALLMVAVAGYASRHYKNKNATRVRLIESASIKQCYSAIQLSLLTGAKTVDDAIDVVLRSDPNVLLSPYCGRPYTINKNYDDWIGKNASVKLVQTGCAIPVPHGPDSYMYVDVNGIVASSRP